MKYCLLTFASLLFLNSCAWVRGIERSLDEDDARQAKRPVTRDQYDQLLVKYEELARKYEALKEGKPVSETSVTSEATDTETVDVFGGAVSTSVPTEVPTDVESQLGLYRRALALKASNPGEATKIFQQLENQGVPAVKVRSKLQVGELLIGRGQHDLALQVFEDIISNHAHSGVVLDALKYAVICADKLGIQNKKDQYSSMINDVFEYEGQGI